MQKQFLNTQEDIDWLFDVHLADNPLWRIRTKSYLEDVEKEELSDLRAQLKALGFSSRAISTAFKSIERTEQ